MQKFKLPVYLIITICLTFGLTVSLQSLLAAWQAPASAPPEGNKPAPIYASSSKQVITDLTGSYLNYAPEEMFEIINTSANTARFRIYDPGQNPEFQLQYGASSKEHWSIYVNNTNDSLKFWSWNYADANEGNRLTILQNGNIGIGIDDPGSNKLNVAGDIYTSTNLISNNLAGCANPLASNASGQIICGTAVIHDSLSLNPIGNNPNIYGASFLVPGGQALVLQPADNSFGGVVTAGAQTFGGNKTFAGLITGNAGLTITGGNVNLNVNSNNPVNIATGNSGAVTIGGGSNTLSINTSGWGINTTGAMTGISGINNDGSYTQSGPSINTFTGTTNFPGSGIWNSSGNVGVGNITPQARLDVTGGIRIGSDTTCLSTKTGTLGYNSGTLQLCTSAGWNNISVGATLPSASNNRTLRGDSSNNWSLSSVLYDTNSRIGIGTNNPSHLLHLQTPAGTNVEIDLQSGTSPYWAFYQDDGTDDLRFWNINNRMTITNEGSVGIGNISPQAALDVSGAVKVGSDSTCNPAKAGSLGYNSGVMRICGNNGTWYTISTSTSAGGGVTGSGSTNYHARWTSGTNLGTGVIYDNGTNVGISDVTPVQKLDVAGRINMQTETTSTDASTIVATKGYVDNIHAHKCPTGYIDAGKFCFEANNRTGGWISPGYTVFQASSGCFYSGGELCTFLQLTYACQRFSAGTDLRNNENEHVFYDGSGDYAAWRSNTNGDCFYRATGQGLNTELPYRCCFTK